MVTELLLQRFLLLFSMELIATILVSNILYRSFLLYHHFDREGSLHYIISTFYCG